MRSEEWSPDLIELVLIKQTPKSFTLSSMLAHREICHFASHEESPHKKMNQPAPKSWISSV